MSDNVTAGAQRALDEYDAGYDAMLDTLETLLCATGTAPSGVVVALQRALNAEPTAAHREGAASYLERLAIEIRARGGSQ